MQAILGQVVDLDAQDNTTGKYLENSFTGSGLFLELLSCDSVLKATILQPDDTLVRVCIPEPDFMKINDLIAVIKDEDGCDFNFSNLTRDTKWYFARAPYETRKYYSVAKNVGNIGMSLFLIMLLPQILLGGQLLPYNRLQGFFLVLAFGAIIWRMTVCGRARKRHLAASRALKQDTIKEHSVYIADKQRQRVEKLKQTAV